MNLVFCFNNEEADKDMMKFDTSTLWDFFSLSRLAIFGRLD